EATVRSCSAEGRDSAEARLRAPHGRRSGPSPADRSGRALLPRTAVPARRPNLRGLASTTATRLANELEMGRTEVQPLAWAVPVVRVGGVRPALGCALQTPRLSRVRGRAFVVDTTKQLLAAGTPEP